jgi:nitroreductase
LEPSLLTRIEEKLPSRLIDWLTLPYATFHKLQQRNEFRRDKLRYETHSSLIESSSSRLRGLPLEAQLTRDYHRVEKALALPAPKRPFGQAYLLARLNRLIPVGESVAQDTSYVAAAVAARNALLEWNSTGTTDASVAPISPVPDDRGCSDPVEFFSSRHSVRHFSHEPVKREDVLEAITLAAYSPSVCNRQPWKVRLFTGEDTLRVLQHQNGNSGFRDNIPMLVLVSVEIGYFYGPGERNQAWIEGGIFASSLVWALHGMGLNSCMLNLSITNGKADRLREDSGMPDSELPIMMIAIGYGAEGHRVARSHRRVLSEIVVDGYPQETSD